MERRVLFAATAPFGSGTHYLDQAPFSTADLSDEAAQANPNATGTQDAAASAGGVRYFDGMPLVSASDLSSDGFGQTWGVTRTYSPDMTGSGPLGNHWFLNQMPELVQEGSADANRPSGTDATVILVSGASDQRWFDHVTTTGPWVERYGGLDSLAATTYSGHSAYVLATTTGQRLYFYDFASGNGSQKGQFLAATDPDGNLTSVTSTDGSGDITEVRRTSGSTYESWLYTFNTPGGVITNVALRRSTNSGSTWTTARQVAYGYDGSGNLTTATIEDGSGTAIGTWYYRYWNGTDTVTEGGTAVTQPANAIKYVLGPEAYARLYASLSSGTPASASDATVATYADDYYTYNAASKVYSVTQAGDGSSSGPTGGQGTYTFAYASNTNVGYAKAFGNWDEKTTETLPDSNTNTVYSNYAGEPILNAFTSGSTNWGTFDEYDSNGRLTREAEPSAVTLPATLSTLDANNDVLHSQSGNYQYLSDDSGMVKVIDYYGTGSAAGYYEDTKLRQGELGGDSLQQARDYTSHSDGTTTICLVAIDIVYRNDNGTGAETTTYAYSFYTGTNQPQTVTETLPTIGGTQNGPNTTDQWVYTYNQYNWVTDVVDGDSKETSISYDTATGAITQIVVDPGAGHLALTTSYSVDLLGRIQQITDPDSNVTVVVYNDTAHETRTYPGWHQIGTSGTYTTTGPVQVSRTYYPAPNAASGQQTLYDESLTFNPPVESTSAPSGSESISEANIQSLSRDLTGAAGQLYETDAYFSLAGVSYVQTTPQLGSSSNDSASGNYHATSLGYDSRGREDHVQDPTGTITDTTFDGLSRQTAVKSGTNDTTSNNMVDVQDLTYDQRRAAPSSAPTLSQSGTGSTGGSTLYVKVTYLGPGGESLASSESSLLVFAGNQLVVTSPATAAGVTGYNVSVSTASGAETQQNSSAVTLGSNWTQPTSGSLVSGSLLPVDQVGDSTLTTSVQHVDSSSSDDRKTLDLYDWRDRQIAEKDGAQSSESTSVHRPVYLDTLDNLGEVTAAYTYDGDTTDLSFFANGQPSTYSGRLRAQVLTSYDDQQQPYLVKQYSVDQSSGTPSSTNILSTNTYYNYRNDVIASVPPGGQAEKDSYDAANRRVLETTSDNGALNGATQDWSTASTTSSDIVLEQTVNKYDAASNLIETIDRQRFDNDPTNGTGEGNLIGPTATGGTNSRDYYTDSYYDAANRPAATADVGTDGGAAWTRSGSVQARSDSYLVTSQSYDADAVQTVALTGGPTGGTFTLTFGGQTTGSIAWNATAATVQSALAALSTIGSTTKVSVTGAAGGPYTVRFISTLGSAVQPTMTANASGLTGGTSPSATAVTTVVGSADTGRVTGTTNERGNESLTDYDLLGRPISTIDDFTDGLPTANTNQTVNQTYDGNGNTLTSTAVQSAGVNQTTGYVYSAGGTAGTNLFSHDLLTTVKYPDPTTGLPSTSSSGQDNYTVNWAGEKLSYTDRNTTKHNYTYDPLGRETMDSVSTFGTGVDSTVKSLAFAYAPLNLAASQTSYSGVNGTGTALNGVSDSYNGFGQLTAETQSFASGTGWTSGSTGTVGYVYNETNNGTENDSKLRATVYADGRVVEADYSALQSPVTGITHSGTTATVTTAGAHGLSAGQTVVIEGATPAAYDGTFTVASVTSSTTFTYTLASTPASNASGSYMTVAAKSLDQAVSRPDGLQDAASVGAALAGKVLESYTYLGSNTIVQASHPQTGINETFIDQGVGDTAKPPSYAATGGDRYVGLDGFGRVVDEYYVKPSALTSPTDRFQTFYDRGSDPLYMNIVEQGTAGDAYDQLYHASGGSDATGYDALDRLTDFTQGTLSASGTNGTGVLDTVATGSVTKTQSWSLDALGNWTNLTASPGPTLARTFDAGNEITLNSGSTTPTYDAAGHVTKDDRGDTLSHDAWGRLMSNGIGVTYQYLPTGQRASATLCSGLVTQFSYFSTDWQQLEDDLPPAGSGSSAQATTYAWGLESSNELVARDDSSATRLYAQHDANFDVTTLIGLSGGSWVPLQRFSYTPYGSPTVLNPTTWASTSDAYNWTFLWKGAAYDYGTGLYRFSSGDYSASLGTWIEPGRNRGNPNPYLAMLGAPVGQVEPHGESVGDKRMITGPAGSSSSGGSTSGSTAGNGNGTTKSGGTVSGSTTKPVPPTTRPLPPVYGPPGPGDPAFPPIPPRLPAPRGRLGPPQIKVEIDARFETYLDGQSIIWFTRKSTYLIDADGNQQLISQTPWTQLRDDGGGRPWKVLG